ncbi:MAG TPA: hypothetical protein VMF88_00060 [Bacteroidota bacterium]|nr:hypothetical protein [Bacteroidota bacterium]
MKDIFRLLEKYTFDVLVPIGFPVTHFVAKHQIEISQYAKIVVPNIESEEIACDKFNIQKIAMNVGVPTPKTFLIKNTEDIADAIKEVGLPIIIKGRRESGKGIVATANSKVEAFHQFYSLVEKYDLAQDDYPIVQEFIHGWGCGFFAIYEQGECKRIFMHRRIREYPPTGGVSCCACSFNDPHLELYGRKLLDALHWNGVAMAEFRYDESKHDYSLIEVNAKFWGSLELALAAGADFPADYVKIATGQELDYTSEYKMTTYQWLLSGDFLHGLKRPSAIPFIIMTAFNPRVHKDFLGIDDPFVLIIRCLKLLRDSILVIFRLR